MSTVNSSVDVSVSESLFQRVTLRRQFALEMLGYALVSRMIMIVAGWYFTWAVTPNWPDVLTGSKLFYPWAQWDGYHYARIAHHGYGDIGDPGISAFFPLYPLIVHIIGLPFGATSMNDYQIIGVIVGWILFLISTYVVASMFRDYFGEVKARTMMLLWLFSPFAFFLSTAYTEALFFIEVAVCFIMLKKRMYWWAALAAAFATATRVTGLALMLPIVWVAWRNREKLISIFLYGCVAVSGLLAYMLHTLIVRDDLFAFLNAQEGWGGFDVRAGTYYKGLIRLREDFLFADVGNGIMLLNMVLYGLALLLLLYGIRKVPLEFTLFSAAVMVQTFISVQSMGRYLLPVITTYIVAAIVLHRLPKSSYWVGIVVSSSLISMVTLFLLFAHGAWVV